MTVRRDARGVPSIEASSAHDLYFAQGYVTASDRLWQMDLLRRSARGELAEIFGSKVLEQDVQLRTLGLGRIAEGLVAGVPQDLREALGAYAEGVNANIAGRGQDGLPSEFAILGYRPRAWLPSDSLVIGKLFALDLDMTWPSELMRASFADLPEARRKELFIEESPLDVVLVEGEKAKIRTTPPDATKPKGALAPTGARGHVPLGSALFGVAASNNWVVAGARSVTGKPILANDPHLSPSAPSIWYMTLLAAPGLRVAGVTAPGVVGVLIGHNERIAWGVTNLMADVQDLYAETFDDAGRYATPAGPRAAQVRKERILVRAEKTGDAAQISEHHVTTSRHGPIVMESGPTRYALRWTALDPDACEVCAFFEIDRAKDWKEFQAALARFSGPPLNFVYADTSNHIGWSAAGRIPIRAGGDGTVPADGRTDENGWKGYVPWSEMPRLFDPPGGLIVTANNRVVGSGYPHPITHAWVAPYRARRIRDLLTANPRIGLDECQAVQGDTVSVADLTFAQALLKAASGAIEHPETLRPGGARVPAKDGAVPDGAPDAQHPASAPEPRQEDALADWLMIQSALTGWDGRAGEGSKVLPLVAATRTVFSAKVLSGALGPERAPAYSWPNRDTLLDRIATGQPADWLPGGYSSYADLFLDCWREARTALAKKTADPPSRWTWGKLADPVVFVHPLAGIPEVGARFAIEPIPASTGGSGETVNAGAAVSMRFIADLSDWDRSRQGIALGESGDPASPHWKDQLSAWRAVKTPELPFSPQAVTRATVEVLILAPAAVR